MIESRTNKAIHNVVAAFVEILVLMVSGLIVPRMIIAQYGSACNGLITSVAKFVSLISVLNVGISGAARVQLYGPLAKGDTDSIARQVCALEKTFSRIGFVSLTFVMILAVLYPIWLCRYFDYWYTALLVIIVSLTTLARYFVGAPYEILLYADQRHSFVSYNRAVVELLMTGLMILLILKGCAIHFVKFSSSIIAVIGSLSLCVLARWNYGITHTVMNRVRHTAPHGIIGRRHAIAQGISDYINSNIDIVLITIFMSVTDVSIYAVYAAVISCCSSLIVSVISSFGAAFGNMYAKGEIDVMRENMKSYELIVFSLCSTVLSTALALIVPFVGIYTSGITDADYYQPVFAVIIVISALFVNFRIPYETVLKACGYFKQTKLGAYFEAGLNLVLSVFGVMKFGLPGVALGTLVSSIIRTSELAWHFGKHLIERPYSIFVCHIVLALAICGIICFLENSLFGSVDSLGDWLLAAGVIFGISVMITILTDWLFYRVETKRLIRRLAVRNSPA